MRDQHQTCLGSMVQRFHVWRLDGVWSGQFRARSSQPCHAGYKLVNIQGAHSGGYDIETFECWNLASATPLLETQVLEF